MKRAVLLVVSLIAPGHACELPAPKPELHVVPTPIKSYRLVAVSMDDDGPIWAGAINNVVHRYDPRAGKFQTIALPYRAPVSACICVSKKVYLLGQTYPKLIVYNRTSKTFSELAYPSARPDAWYGTEAIDGRHFFLFDRGSAGVIKWDSQIDTGKVIPWPYKAPFPWGRSYEPRDKALWCKVWDFAKRPSAPLMRPRWWSSITGNGTSSYRARIGSPPSTP
jgi:hypothetical protein